MLSPFELLMLVFCFRWEGSKAHKKRSLKP